MPPSRLDRPGAEAACRARDPRRRRPPPAGRARWAKSPSARAANIKGYWRNPRGDRRHCSPPTATSAPATSAISTKTAICSSSTARKTSSSAAARISPRPRSRPNATPAPRSPKWRCSERPTSGSAKCRSPIVHAKNGDCSRRRAARLPRRRARQVQNSGAVHLSRMSRCRASAPARSTGAR